MTDNKLTHFKYEWETWYRTLDYIKLENVFLKNCLADIIQNDIDTPTLEQVEYFQNQFLNKDTIIALLKYDISELNKESAHEYEPGNEFNNLLKKQSRLRADMEKMEKEFSRLKFQFNNYIAEAL